MKKHPNVQAEVITIINYFFWRIHYHIRSDYRKGSDGAVRGKRSWRLPACFRATCSVREKTSSDDVTVEEVEERLKTPVQIIDEPGQRPGESRCGGKPGDDTQKENNV